MASPSTQEKIIRRKRFIRSFEKKALQARSYPEKVADAVTNSTGSISFLLLNVYWFFIWIAINSNMIPGIVPFDPFPFGLLTMIVSLEAIILSIFVLLSQNRQSHIDKLREEVNLQVNFIAEEEITKALQLLDEIRQKVGIKREDPELTKMLERIDASYIERTLQRQIEGESMGFLKMMNPISAISSHNGSDAQKNKEEKSQEKEAKK